MKLSQRELLEIFCGKTVINKSINEAYSAASVMSLAMLLKQHSLMD